ncbi:hypothetical protein [Clostridium tagluense]|uniref:Uncharacterized protein n=1 Tax=Clostridium tagluense TaxID=360422 RepID=A0A401ULK9_9CLOT|nr:hypothetical protein [Clostridium tagluense]GCD10410.1 hypothetical protein Ctaglu_20330 [Clostridium tagluense]
MKMDINLIRTDLVTIEDIGIIQELWQYAFPNRVYAVYKSITRKNSETTYLQAKKKLIRDILLSNEAPIIKGSEHRRIFYYGNLTIEIDVVKRSICYIANDKGKFRFTLNKEKRAVLNEIMNIKESM